MKTLRDTNNNNSNLASNSTQQHFSASTSVRSNSNHLPTTVETEAATQNRLQQSIWRSNPDQSPINGNSPSGSSSPKLNNPPNSNLIQPPLASLVNGDINQFSSLLQTYLAKFGGSNPFLQSDTFNPLLYLQLMNTNTMFMQQLAALQSNPSLATYEPNKQYQPASTDQAAEHSKKSTPILQADSNVFVPKTRPMTQDEIAEHARLVYQRALQRNQLQQHNDLMKHFYETLNLKQSDSCNPIKSTHPNEVPGVPNVSNITPSSTFEGLDTMIPSPSSCLSMKEASVNAALSSLSLMSVDDTKMMSNTSSTLDPGAPVFIPRQSRLKVDDENETSSSSSVSDFHDFHYLDQFLEEFYHSDNEHDNHLIVRKASHIETTAIGDEYSTNNNKYSIHQHTLGQGDAIEQLPCESVEDTIETTTTSEKQEQQYSIHDLLNRYRNPRCHLVLPEWSRLSLILPNVCTMRAHTYKIKRYFAYRRPITRRSKSSKDSDISVQG